VRRHEEQIIWLHLRFFGSIGESRDTGKSCSVSLAALSSTVCVVLLEVCCMLAQARSN